MTIVKNGTTVIGAAGENSEIVSGLQGKFKIVLNGTFSGTFKVLKRYKDQKTVATQDGGDTQAAFTDSTMTAYAIDELIGAWIGNDDTGSFGPITDNTATVVTATQIGGTDQTWDDDETASFWEEIASYTTAQYVEIEEPEAGCDYIVICSAYSSGKARVRISQ